MMQENTDELQEEKNKKRGRENVGVERERRVEREDQ